MRQKIAAGNWKMHKNYSEAISLAESITEVQVSDNVKVILGVPFVYLKEIHELVHSTPSVEVAAQNCHSEDAGAFTGEISPSMLKSIGVRYVILGHSERRQYYGEQEAWILEKMNAAYRNGLHAIYCCGEPLDIRKAGNHKSFVKNQLEGSILKLSVEQLSSTVIAYEPVWAIGTGETASPAQAQEMHAFIRACIADKFGSDKANEISILYGGSVKAANATELFQMEDVDGGLVGGASLIADEFISIIKSLSSI
ncbi:MAG TPA: triose-phosphate isomerase [Saprospiraceae bacterium]|jgi:triosephosphate isomerase|nr:triose-phosphate isomerase [Saprospiraceae bacterium]